MIKKKQYSSYKDSGIDGIGKIPEHWETNKIKNLFEFSKGLNITKKDLTETGIPVISYGQIHAKFNDGIHIKDELIRHTDKTKAKTNSKVSKGDFIFADTSEDLDGCGNSIYINKEMLLYGGYHDVILKSKINRDNTYLAYLFQSKKWRSQIKSKVSGVKVYSINQSILKECYIILPNTDEQEQIAKYLDKQTTKIDQTVTKNKKLITLLKEKRTTLINQTVTKGLNPDAPMKESGIEWIGKIPEHWNLSKIKHELKFLDYKRIPLSAEERSNLEKKYDYYGASGIIDKVDDYIFEGTYILIGEDGANLLYRNLPLAFLAKGKFWVNNHAHILDVKKGNITYFMYLLEQVDYTNYITGSAQPKLSADNLKNIQIIKPPVEEQKNISEYLDEKIGKINQTIQKIEKNIELLEEYKDSLIHHVVTGKIDVRGVEV